MSRIMLGLGAILEALYSGICLLIQPTIGWWLTVLLSGIFSGLLVFFGRREVYDPSDDVSFGP